MEHEKNHEHCCGDACESEGCGCCHEEEENEITLKQIIVATALFVVALVIEHVPIFQEGSALLSSKQIFGQAVLIAKLVLLCAAYLICGKNVLIGAVKNILHGKVFDEKFLMSVASIGAIILGEYPEAVAVMLLYQIGEYFQDSAVDKSRDSIKSLVALRPDKAFVLHDGNVVEMRPEEVAVGDTIQVKPGERIPLDGIVVEGNSFVDTSALTGESVPREIFSGMEVMAGFINTSGLVKIKVSKLASESSATRIIEMVENASAKKAHAEKFITRFAKVYTPLVCLGAVLVAIVPPIFANAEWTPWISRALMFLVVSCPCALVISVPLSFFGGIGSASKRGILIKGSNYIESLALAKTAVFDKTGTLTQGVFVVNEIHPAHKSKISEEELLAIATHAEKFSDHPISKSLKNAHHCEKCDSVVLGNIQEIAGEGISVELDGAKIFAGNLKLMKNQNVQQISPCEKEDFGTVVHVAIDGIYAGHIVISDKPKEQSKEAISQLKKLGVKKTVMLTGDGYDNAEATAKILGIDEFRAELLPEEKVGILEEFLQNQKGKKVLFAGDGINDAPVLARADVGIAMGALGSDAAIEAADVVIMNDNPLQIASGIKIARKTMGIVKQNITISLAVKFAVMILAVFGIANMWLAVFGDVGVTLLAVLNSLRVTPKEKDA